MFISHPINQYWVTLEGREISRFCVWNCVQIFIHEKLILYSKTCVITESKTCYSPVTVNTHRSNVAEIQADGFVYILFVFTLDSVTITDRTDGQSYKNNAPNKQ